LFIRYDPSIVGAHGRKSKGGVARLITGGWGVESMFLDKIARRAHYFVVTSMYLCFEIKKLSFLQFRDKSNLKNVSFHLYKIPDDIIDRITVHLF
jgi:hypothetical protein